MELSSEEEIGRGSSAQLWLAEDAVGRRVAVKFIDGDEPTVNEEVSLNHARALARIDHDGVVRFYSVEVQKHPDRGEECLCVIMEYVDAPWLSQDNRVFSRRSACAAIRQLSGGLEAIHRANLAHGDLHDGNVLISENGAKLIDILYTNSLRTAGTTDAVQEQRADLRRFAAICRKITERVSDIDQRLLAEAFYQASATQISTASMVAECFTPLLTSEDTKASAINEPSRTIASVQLEYEQLRAELENGVWDTLRGFRNGPSFETVSRMLRELTGRGAIASSGVVTRIPHSYAKVIFSLDENQVRVTLVPSRRSAGSHFRWTSKNSAAEALSTMATICRTMGSPELTSSIGADLFEQLLETCNVGAQSRCDGDLPGDFKRAHYVSPEFAPLVMVVNPQWALTSQALESLTSSYPIEGRRLGEQDWLRHLSMKHWVDYAMAEEALDIGRSYFAGQVVEYEL